MELKKEQYIREGGVRCPYCASEDIEGTSFESDLDFSSQKITCNNCGKRWEDIYTLIDIIEIN